MKYVVEARLECTYEIEAEDEEIAKDKAAEYFYECTPHMKVTPCEEKLYPYLRGVGRVSRKDFLKNS